MNDRSALFALTSWPARAARCRFPIVCLLVLLFPSYRADGATLKKVFAVGDPVEGLAGITVQLVTHAKLTGDGRVVAVVWLQGPGVVAANRKAIVSAVPGGPVQLWGRVGDPVLIGGAVNSTNVKGIWRWDGAALRLLARQGEEVPGLPGRHWSDVRTGLALPSGKGVFSAFVPEAGSPTNPTKVNWSGLWWGEANYLEANYLGICFGFAHDNRNGRRLGHASKRKCREVKKGRNLHLKQCL